MFCDHLRAVAFEKCLTRLHAGAGIFDDKLFCQAPSDSSLNRAVGIDEHFCAG